MMQYRFRPIERWPRSFTKDRRSSQFRSSYADTVDLLVYELEWLRARNIVIQTAMEERDIRQDGLPRAGARKPAHPGVILSFESPKGAISMPCDRFLEWDDNLRAIALTLQHLRAVDRYGVTQSGEQYRGWAQLPEPDSAKPGFETYEQAATFVINFGKTPATPWAFLSDPELYTRVYRQAAQKLHPDTGGDHDRFVRLQVADKMVRETIEKAFGI